jgi:hypothetical protein
MYVMDSSAMKVGISCADVKKRALVKRMTTLGHTDGSNVDVAAGVVVDVVIVDVAAMVASRCKTK